MKTRLPITLLLAGTVMMSSLAMTACTSTPTDAGKPLPELTFEQMNRIPVNVSRIEFINSTQRGANLWDSTANNLPTSPDIAMRRYLAQRFFANGTDGVLNINLTKATVTETEVPNDMKILSYTALANQTNYRFEFEIDLERLYLSGQPNLKTTVRFTRDARMPVNVTLAYKEARLQRTLEEIMRDIDEALITSIGYQFNLISPNNIPRRSLPVNTELPEYQTRIGEFTGQTMKKIQGDENTAPTPDTTRPTPLVTAPQDNSVAVERLD